MTLDEKIQKNNTEMNNEKFISPNTFLQRIESYFFDLKYSNAYSLVRRGYYTQAEILVSEILADYGGSPKIFDLQARIFAQTGKFYEAQVAWNKALKLDPSNSAYQQALLRLSKIQRYPIWQSSLYNLFIGLLFIFVLFIGIAFFLNQIKKDTYSKFSEMAQENITIKNSLNQRFASIENSILKFSKSESSKFYPFFDLNISNISTRIDKNELVILFDKGLFKRGASLNSEAKILLTQLGKQLEPYSDRVNIKIYGTTDNLPIPEGQKFRDNIDLGKARASEVYNYLRMTTGLPASRLLIGSLGSILYPFPNKTLNGQAKNRSVIIRISYE